MLHPSRPHSRAELLRTAAGLAVGAFGLIQPLQRAFAAGVPGPTLVSRDELRNGGRALLDAHAPLRFHAIGLHWRGSGTVSFRPRLASGGFAEWLPAVSHELPDPGGIEDGLAGWRLGTLVWTGESIGVQYRLEGVVNALRGHFVWSPTRRAGRALALAEQPTILSRSGWEADETIVRAPPLYAERVSAAIVHHTAGGAPASPAESAAVVRAIQTYHVKANGWNDIGYNFLVDPFGQVFEGRGGGIDRPVVGAHAAGYNTGSCGIALLGQYGKTVASADARSALASLLSWRLDGDHVDPLSLAALSGVPLRAVSGHRDVNSTACPGDSLYAELDAIAADAQALGLPKVYEPRVERLGDRVFRFSARLSEPLGWSVSVTTTGGATVATASGNGTLVDWTWDATAVVDGRYPYVIAVVGTARPAAGTVRVGEPPAPSEPPPRPVRPGSVPRRIPAWAWELAEWHARPSDQRGPRPPTAPRKLPHWYWEWLHWRSALDRWTRENAPQG